MSAIALKENLRVVRATWGENLCAAMQTALQAKGLCLMWDRVIHMQHIRSTPRQPADTCWYRCGPRHCSCGTDPLTGIYPTYAQPAYRGPLDLCFAVSLPSATPVASAACACRHAIPHAASCLYMDALGSAVSGYVTHWAAAVVDGSCVAPAGSVAACAAGSAWPALAWRSCRGPA